MRRIVLIVFLAGLTSALVAVTASGELAQAGAGAAPVREQNLDGTGFIRVHEQGTPTVRVESSEPAPVLTRNLDDPARNPTEGGGFVLSGDCLLLDAVPAGKRLVIDYVSAEASIFDSGPWPGTMVFLSLLATGGGGVVRHFISLEKQGAELVDPQTGEEKTVFRGGGEVTVYADPLTEVHVCFSLQTGPSSDGANADVEFSGHYVDVSGG